MTIEQVKELYGRAVEKNAYGLDWEDVAAELQQVVDSKSVDAATGIIGWWVWDGREDMYATVRAIRREWARMQGLPEPDEEWGSGGLADVDELISRLESIDLEMSAALHSLLIIAQRMKESDVQQTRF